MSRQKLTLQLDNVVVDEKSKKVGFIKHYDEDKNYIEVLFEDGTKWCYSPRGVAHGLGYGCQTLYDYNAQSHSDLLTVGLNQDVISEDGNVGRIVSITRPCFTVKFEDGNNKLYRFKDFFECTTNKEYMELKTLVNYDPTKHSKYKLIEVKHKDGTWRKRGLAFIWNNIAYCYNNQLTDSEIIDRKNHYILSDIIAYTEWREIQKEITLTDLIKKAGFNPEHIHVGELTCEVGQKVYHKDYGNGVVIEYRGNTRDVYCIKVQFDNEQIVFFAKDGKLNIDHHYPELFNLVETEGLKKVLVRDNEYQEWKVRFLQSVITKEKVISWTVNVDVDEIKDILNDRECISNFDVSTWNYHKEIPYVSIQELWDKANLNPDEYRLINNLN